MTDANLTANLKQPAADSTTGHGGVSHGVNASAPSPSAEPAKNPLGAVAFVLAIVMLVLGSTFAMILTVYPGPIVELQLVLLVQAATGVLLSLVVVVLATISLVMKNRRRMLGAIALGAGGYALLATILSFLSNAVVAVFS